MTSLEFTNRDTNMPASVAVGHEKGIVALSFLLDGGSECEVALDSSDCAQLIRLLQDAHAASSR